jgi:hypothetical protein
VLTLIVALAVALGSEVRDAFASRAAAPSSADMTTTIEPRRERTEDE